MIDTIADGPIVYTSPLSEEVLASVGRLITAWAAVEAVMPRHVARLIATRDPLNPQGFAHAAYIRAAAVLIGTPAAAALNQIQNLIGPRKAEIKRAGDAILEVKTKRDAVAHNISGPVSELETQFHGFGFSRHKAGSDKFYSVKQLDGWCDALTTNARAIDTVVTEVTGWSCKDIDADLERWNASLRALASEMPDKPPH